MIIATEAVYRSIWRLKYAAFLYIQAVDREDQHPPVE